MWNNIKGNKMLNNNTNIKIFYTLTEASNLTGYKLSTIHTYTNKKEGFKSKIRGKLIKSDLDEYLKMRDIPGYKEKKILSEIIKVKENKNCTEYTFYEVSLLTGLKEGTIKSYTSSNKEHYEKFKNTSKIEFIKSSKGCVFKESVDNYLFKLKKNEYFKYRNSCINFKYIPNTFEEWESGNTVTFNTIPNGYILYEEAKEILQISESSMRNYVYVNNYLKSYSKEFPEILELSELLKFKTRNDENNLIFCNLCKCKKNYLHFKKYNDELCDKCVENKPKLISKNKENLLKTKKRNLKIARAARKEKLKNELKEKIDYINKKYGSTICEINNYYFIEKKQETLKVLEYCNSILRKRNSKYIKSLKEKATLRLEQLKEQDLRDYDMSITGYKFDF